MPTLKERLSKSKGDIPKNILQHSLNLVLDKMGLRDKINKYKIGDSAFNMLINYEYEGNYRELESILIAAVISVNETNRDQILSYDLDLMKEYKKEAPEDQKATYEDIELTEIINHADKIRASIIESKIKEFISCGGNIGKYFRDSKKYQGFRNKVKNITGKGIRDFRNN
jgi:transcriptional regulator with GAF, ATPase, and Fis domain